MSILYHCSSGSGILDRYKRSSHVQKPLFGFKGFAKQIISVKGRNLLLITMFGSTFRSILFAGLCLSDSQNLAEDQVVLGGGGSPVLRRFNLSSPTQLKKTLEKAQVRNPCARHRCAHDKHLIRTMASMSGRLPRHTSISTSHLTRLYHPSSYRSRISRCPTSSPLKRLI